MLTRKPVLRNAIIVAIGLQASIANAQIEYTSTSRFVSAEAQNQCETEFVSEETDQEGAFGFVASATANPVVGCDNLIEAFATHNSTFGPNLIAGQTQVFAEAFGNYNLATATSRMEATFSISADTPFILRGAANSDGFVRLTEPGGLILGELSNTIGSEITGTLPAGDYSFIADVSSFVVDGMAGGDYVYSFELVPEPAPASMLMLGIIPLLHLVRSRRFSD